MLVINKFLLDLIYLQVVATFEYSLLDALDEVAAEVQQFEAAEAMELAAREDGVQIVSQQVVSQPQLL